MPNSLIQNALLDPEQKKVLEALSSGSAAGGVGVGYGVGVEELGGSGAYRTTILTLTNVPMTVRDTQQGNGVKVYTFPKGKIFRLGASAENVIITTTSALASTLNAGVTGNFGVGSTTQANGTLATTEQDFVQTTNFTTSATVNVAPAAARGYGVPNVTLLDGSSTAIDLYFNIGIATATDIDADATVTISGTITINWLRV